MAEYKTNERPQDGYRSGSCFGAEKFQHGSQKERANTTLQVSALLNANQQIIAEIRCASGVLNLRRTFPRMLIVGKMPASRRKDAFLPWENSL